MSTEKFSELISGYCRQAGVNDAAPKILQGAPLNVDGVLFALTHDQNAHPDRAYVYCDLGLLPEDRKEEASRLLLEMNMTLHPVTGQSMMISPETDHILLGADLRLQDATANKLDDMLTSLSKVAQNWRKNFSGST